jgi:hypothetical protein
MRCIASTVALLCVLLAKAGEPQVTKPDPAPQCGVVQVLPPASGTATNRMPIGTLPAPTAPSVGPGPLQTMPYPSTNPSGGVVYKAQPLSPGVDYPSNYPVVSPQPLSPAVPCTPPQGEIQCIPEEAEFYPAEPNAVYSSRRRFQEKPVTSEKAKKLVEKNPKLVRTLLESLAAAPTPDYESTFLEMASFPNAPFPNGASMMEKLSWAMPLAALKDLGSAAVPELLKALDDKDLNIVRGALLALVLESGYSDFPQDKVFASLLEKIKTQSESVRPHIRFTLAYLTVRLSDGTSFFARSVESGGELHGFVPLFQQFDKWQKKAALSKGGAKSRKLDTADKRPSEVYDGLRGKKVAVICRSCFGTKSSEPKLAETITELVENILAKNISDIQLVDAKNSKDLQTLKADRVVVVDINSFSIEFDGAFNTESAKYRCRSNVSVRAYDCQKTDDIKEVFAKILPDNSISLSQATVEGKLHGMIRFDDLCKRNIAMAIGNCFYEADTLNQPAFIPKHFRDIFNEEDSSEDPNTQYKVVPSAIPPR